jgi:hypothetical protein
MLDVIEQGRVLVDRDGTWSALLKGSTRWHRAARRVERSVPAASMR